jgi:HK97 family phage prohead protease
MTGVLEHTTDRLALELRSTEIGDAGVFEGHASWFGEIDAVGDTVAPGAFTQSLAERRPLLLWMHDPAEPVGVWEVVRETARGLYVKGRLILETARGREAYALLKAKALDGLSIGFRTIRSVRTKTGRLLQELQLEEISLVTMPALASARVTTVKFTSNVGRRSIPEKDPFIMTDTVTNDGAVEDAELPLEERLDTIVSEVKAATDGAHR